MGLCISYGIYQSLKLKNSSIPLFDLKGNEYNVKVVDIYDGDTCHVVIYFNNKWTKFKIRCLGYDSPEIKPSKNLKNRDKVINKAIEARNYFISKVTDCNIDVNKKYTKKELQELLLSNRRVIKLKCMGWDKYGRLLGEFYYNNKNINNEMIEKGYGYKYDGGTKKETLI